jgi:hypothetical protein
MDIEIYDKAKWHFEHEDFPSDVPRESAYLYGGCLLAWLTHRDLLSDEILDDFPDEFSHLRSGELLGSQVYQIMDGVLDSSMLTEDGNAFVRFCFESDEFDYYNGFETAVASDLPSIYHAADEQATYDRMQETLDEAFRLWQEQNSA